MLIGGVNGNRAERLRDHALSIEGVRILHRVSDQVLAELYRHSAGLLFPSLYEGFGIPILEAHSLDCPVVTSDHSSMPEVAGDAAVFVNAYSAEDICAAMLTLGGDSTQMLVEARATKPSTFLLGQCKS